MKLKYIKIFKEEYLPLATNNGPHEVTTISFEVITGLMQEIDHLVKNQKKNQIPSKDSIWNSHKEFEEMRQRIMNLSTFFMTHTRLAKGSYKSKDGTIKEAIKMDLGNGNSPAYFAPNHDLK